MNERYEKVTVHEFLRGGEITFTATDKLIMIHSDTLCCQFPRESILPMVEEVPDTHGILRFIDQTYLEMGMSLFIRHKDLVPLVMFLQKHTKSRVIV